MNVSDRAAGAVIGALIGDALGLGPHWYYDLADYTKITAVGLLATLTQSRAVTILE